MMVMVMVLAIVVADAISANPPLSGRKVSMTIANHIDCVYTLMCASLITCSKVDQSSCHGNNRKIKNNKNNKIERTTRRRKDHSSHHTHLSHRQPEFMLMVFICTVVITSTTNCHHQYLPALTSLPQQIQLHIQLPSTALLPPG